MARHRLAARGIGWAPRTTVALAFAVLVIGGPALWAWRSVGPPPSPADDVAAVEALGEWAASMAAAGPVRLLLQIPRILVRPALAQGAGAFLAALLPAVVLVVVNERWVLRSAVSLQEGALDEARHRAGRRQARSQRRAGRPSGYTPLPAPVALSPAGRPETALMWKSLIQVTRSLGWRGSLRLTIVVAAVVAMVVVNARRHEAVGILLGVICGAIAMILLIAGPRLLRSDFSQELLHIDLLRSYPVSGRSLVIGTLLAPVAIVTVLQWVMTLGVVLFAGGVLEGRGLPPFTVAAGALAAAILMPAMNLVGAILHNAAILLLPGWVGIGSARGAGIEVLGQRIITGVGRILALLITFLPAAAVFAAALFVLTLFAPLTVALPLAAAPAALALGVEAAAGVLILGSVLDRFDPPTELDGWNP